VALYLDSTPATLEALRQAVARGDARALYQGAHRLKSSSATIGANKLTKLFSELEALGKAQDLEHSGTALEQVLKGYDLVRQALSSYLAKEVS
jgi:two-component system sensor histidine kinase/response regulator